MRLKELYQDKVCLLSYLRADCLAGELMQLQSPKGLCVAQCGPAAVTQLSVGTDWLSCAPLVHLCSVVSTATRFLFSFLSFFMKVPFYLLWVITGFSSHYSTFLRAACMRKLMVCPSLLRTMLLSSPQVLHWNSEVNALVFRICVLVYIPAWHFICLPI